jgi:hypothetical protein
VVVVEPPPRGLNGTVSSESVLVLLKPNLLPPGRLLTGKKSFPPLEEEVEVEVDILVNEEPPGKVLVKVAVSPLGMLTNLVFSCPLRLVLREPRVFPPLEVKVSMEKELLDPPLSFPPFPFLPNFPIKPFFFPLEPVEVVVVVVLENFPPSFPNLLPFGVLSSSSESELEDLAPLFGFGKP